MKNEKVRCVIIGFGKVGKRRRICETGLECRCGGAFDDGHVLVLVSTNGRLCDESACTACSK